LLASAGAKSSKFILLLQKLKLHFLSSANDKAKYEEKALKDKERYEREKAEFIAAGGEMTKAAPAKKQKKATSSSSKSPTKSPAKASTSAKSAEFVASSSSDSDSD
jgi:hypothetical protein